MLAIFLAPLRAAIRHTTRQVAGEAFAEGLTDFRGDLATAIEQAAAEPGPGFVERLKIAMGAAELPAVEDKPATRGRKERAT